MARKDVYDRPGATVGPETRIAVFFGKEAFLRTTQTDRLKDAIAAHGHDVEVLRFDGTHAQAADVLDECRSFGLLSGHKLVIVDNAATLISGDTRPLFERYAEAPTESCTLVLRDDTWRAGKLDQLIRNHGVIIECAIKTDAEAVTLLRNRAKRDYSIDLPPPIAARIVERVGPDLSRLAAELEKLAAAADQGVITEELVDELVGRTRLEENPWAVQGPLLSGDVESGLAFLRDLIEVSRLPTVPIRYACVDLARRLHAASQGELRGPGSRELAAAARRLSPEQLASLLRDAVRADRHAKTGFGEETVDLEVLALRLMRVIAASPIDAAHAAHRGT